MNVFNVSNPARIMDALIELCDENTLVFLPSRRAIRAAERSFAAGRAGVLLPQFVALGESDELTEDAEPQTPRIIEYSKLVRAMFPEMSMSGALSLAAELVTMADYIETEQIPIPDWEKLVDEKYAEHFQTKAKFLNIIKNISADNTAARRRNENIKNWIGKIGDYGRVIVCGSTGSIPATRRLMAAVAMAENGMVILPGKVRRMKDEGRSETNPYFSELNFLEKIGITPDEIKTINNGESNIDFFNAAFNDTTSSFFLHPSASRIDCQHEYIESRTVADIAAAAAGNVMIVTPDAAFGTRVASELTARNIAFDNSGGTPAADTPLGRLILMLCELWTNPIDSNVVFDDIKNHPRVKNIDGIVPGNIFETLQNICEITDDDLPILSALSPALEGEFPPPLAGGVARGATGGG
ncbi:MAG: hypothetical protein LBR41_01875, partial [Rickettsiales bacterium]|nr:hypothetical protein [Rickettsiales bacterium]